MSINSLLVALGSSKQIEPVQDLKTLINDFDLNTYSKAPAIYDYEDLKKLNQKLVHNLSYKDAINLLSKYSLHVNEDFWESVKGNIQNLPEIREWIEVCHTKLNPEISPEDSDFLKQTSDALPSGTWNNETWNEWIANIKKFSDRSGKKLFLPIRMALTNKETGPELKLMLPLIGKERVTRRLNGEVA